MSATAQAQAAITSSARRLMSWAGQGIESFVAVQKILMDLTAQQNALAIGAIRERIQIPNVKTAVVKTAGMGVEGLTGAGKILLELAAGQTAILVEGLKEGLRLPAPAGAAAEIVRLRVDTLIGLHIRLLESVAEQARAAVASDEEGKGALAGTDLAGLARQALDDFVSTEKKFLDLVGEEVNKMVEPAKGGHKARPRAKVLAQAARESVDKYADAQKKLVELAIDQFESNGKAAEPEEPPTPLAELAQKGVQNFVTAQKSLMDVALKPPKSETAERPSARPRRKTAAKRATA